MATQRESRTFAAFAVVYGICETLHGNWSQLDLASELGASTTQAAFAPTAFLAMETAERAPVETASAGLAS
jgi:hypothetical protein